MAKTTNQGIYRSKAIDVVLNIGHNVGRETVWSTAQVVESVIDCLSVPGCTAVPCMGAWNGVIEPSTEVHIVVNSLAEARRIESLVPALAHNLDQSAILCELRPSGGNFITAL